MERRQEKRWKGNQKKIYQNKINDKTRRQDTKEE